MKKYLIISTIVATAALSAVLAQHVLPGKKPQHQEKQYNSTPAEIRKIQNGQTKQGFFSKMRSKARNFLKPDENKPIEITHLTSDSCQYSETREGVTVHAKALTTSQECLDELGKGADRLVRSTRGKRNKIFPIKMTIKNNTGQAISLQNIETKIASKKLVQSKLYCWGALNLTLLGLGIFASAVVLGFTGGVGACFLVPVTGCPCCVLWPIVLCTGAGALTGAIASPTAMFIYSSRSTSTRTFIGKKIKKTSLESFGKIAPYETKTVMFFVREKNYQPQFDLTLNGSRGPKDSLKFNIKLPEIETTTKKKRKKK